METFRWAYIGSGSIAKNTARSITRGGHEIVSVWSRNYKTASAFAAKHNAKAYKTFEEAVTAEGVDGVYIATPHTSHLEYSVRAMELGKPVLCEKPVGVSTAEVDALINASKEYGIYFCEAMWTWFSDVALTVKKWVKDGRIGDIRRVEIDYAFPGLMMSKNSRVLTPSTAGGALLDIGIYPITYCYNLFGYPKSVNCEGTLQNGIDVAETVTLGYDGFECVLRMALSGLKEDCLIEGSNGSVRLKMFHMASKARLTSDGKTEVFKGKTDYLTEFTRVASEIRSGKTESEYVPFNSTRGCMKIMDECRKQMNLVYPFEAEKGDKA